MDARLGFDRALEFARDLIRIPSLSGQEGEIARRVMRELEALGFDDVWADGIGNVLGRIHGRDRVPGVMLCSHLDAVDVGDRASWEYPPFDAALAGGRLHGRGAVDIKGPLALQVYAAAQLVEERPRQDLYVAFTVLEEVGGGGMAYLLGEGGVRPAVVVLGEATRGDVCIGHRGHLELEVELRGRAGHAGAPHRADSPIRHLPALLGALERFAAGLPTHPALERATVTPTDLDTLPRGGNLIPERVRVTLDCRVLPGTTEQQLTGELRAYLLDELPRAAAAAVEVNVGEDLERGYTGLERRRTRDTPGFLMDEAHPLVQVARRSVEASAGSVPAVRPWTFATDGGHSCGTYGIPTLGFAPGDEALAHTNRESLDLDEARAAYLAYPHLVRALDGACRSADAVVLRGPFQVRKYESTEVR